MMRTQHKTIWVLFLIWVVPWTAVSIRADEGLSQSAMTGDVADEVADEMAKTWIEAPPEQLTVTSPGLALPVASALMELLSAEALELRLWLEPERIPIIYTSWGLALDTGANFGCDGEKPTAALERLHLYSLEVANHRARRLARTTPAAPDAVRLLAAMLQIQPQKFRAEGNFRHCVAIHWSRLDTGKLPKALLERLIENLSEVPTLEFDVLEETARHWGVIPRSTARRNEVVDAPRMAAPRMAAPRMAAPRTDSALQNSVAGELAPIEASLFSFPPWLSVERAAKFLTSVRSRAPERRLLVLTDAETRRRFGTELRPPELEGIDWLPSLGLDYSPWPRDPMSWQRRADGGLHGVLRGNIQTGRTADQWMARAFLQSLPADLEQRWRRPTWHRSEQPFHNGHILDAGGASWVSVHSLEPRILQHLDLDRLPVEEFDREAGAAFLTAAREAANDLAAIRGRPVHFVHALPDPGLSGSERTAELRSLAGGAGIDLDSVLTLLPKVEADGQGVALVSDLDLGRVLLENASAREIQALVEGYQLGGSKGPASVSKQALLAGQQSMAAEALDLFLEQIVTHLHIGAARPWTVRRIPLLYLDEPDPFLVTWNNVVLELTDEGATAEGFASLSRTGDELANSLFEDAGYRLKLHPPLVESVRRNGGFRCASQQIRRSVAASGQPAPDSN